MSWISLGLAISGLPALAASLYLGALAVLARRPALSPPLAPILRFDVVVPAHDEEAGIARTVESLLAVDYPRELFRVLVIADNCRDRTAERARAAGAQVLVRTKPEQRGKGYALAFAFNHSLAEDFADAVVVVDADTVVTNNLLSAFAARFGAGAVAVQAEYGVRNPRSSWRTRIMTIALATFHGVRSLARERLRLSSGLRGNGMGFSKTVLRAKPYNAFSIVEDVEYGLELAYAGFRVHYVPEARVLGQMVATEQASRSQRRRWEGGRQALVRKHLRRLVGQAWHERNWMLLDLAIDLIVPPLAQLVAVNAAGVVLCVLAAWLGGRVFLAAWVWGASCGGVLFYVIRGWALSGSGASGVLDLLWAPVYVIWKLTLRFKDRGQPPEDPERWVRTTREIPM
jgi:1,2-diacylglycerol 3-beta-glucosyltransferase